MKKSKSFGSDGTLTDSGGSVDTAETDAGDAEMAPCAQAPAQPPVQVAAATAAPALSSPAHVPPCAKAPAEPPVQVAAATAAPTLTVPVPVNASPPVQVAPTPQLPAVAPPAVASSRRLQPRRSHPCSCSPHRALQPSRRSFIFSSRQSLPLQQVRMQVLTQERRSVVTGYATPNHT